MTLLTFSIPDDPRQLADWLERQLVGRELRQLVIELKAILGETDRKESLDAICGDELFQVLEGGVSHLQPESIGRLLKSPQSLFTLQERVLIEGGDYWETIPREELHLQAVEAGQQRLQQAIARGTGPTRTISPDSMARKGLVVGLISMVAVAACLFVAVLALPPEQPPAWGFDRPGVLAAQVPPKEYLENLANAARDWFKKRPEDQTGLAKRLAEFRHGCDTLIAAEHSQLDPKDRVWLKERCQAWAAKIDVHLADLEAGQKSVKEVRSEADTTMNALIKALRTRIS